MAFVGGRPRTPAGPAGGRTGIHGNDTVDALAQAHGHRDEARF
ncbi:hypothetical protein [Streptomyces variabilis]|nr:hypothetical protein [Streptomyces variabilis]